MPPNTERKKDRKEALESRKMEQQRNRRAVKEELVLQLEPQPNASAAKEKRGQHVEPTEATTLRCYTSYVH